MLITSEQKDCLELLRQNRHRMTRRQLLTIRGQILSGDVKGAVKGIQTLTGGSRDD